MAIPTVDALLLDWSTNANTRLTSSPATYGTTATVATAYAAVHAPFATAFENLVAARSSGVRSEPLTAIKSAAKFALLNFARPLYKQIQANTAVTAAAKIELGVHVPNTEPTPWPPPGIAPELTVVSVNGRSVRVRMSDPAHPTRRRLPLGVDGATVLSYVGPVAPTIVPGPYKYEGGTARSTFDVLFPNDVAPGTQIWLVAFFFNERKQNGPACAPVGALINYGGTIPMAA